jgi:hypothetical protein
MTNSTPVKWTSHTSKPRTGRVICPSAQRPSFMLVLGFFDERVHIIHKSRLNLLSPREVPERFQPGRHRR